MVCRPDVDPSILIHRDPRAWEELLGWGYVEAIMRKMKLLGVGISTLWWTSSSNIHRAPQTSSSASSSRGSTERSGGRM
jgi:hypothetical protein